MADRREYQRRWKAAKYAADPEPARAAQRRYHMLHRDRINKARNLARAENKNRINQEPVDRYISDENFRIAAILRATLRGSLINQRRGGDFKAGARVRAIVGCRKGDLIAHIEARFLPGMSWENYGRNGWEIDHIRPCASFDLTRHADVLSCFHYTNLRPLWRDDNRSKGRRS